MEKKFVKTTIQVEVLSEEGEYNNLNLDDMHYDITWGHYSGCVKLIGHVELSPTHMAQALREQGSDPEFFRLDDEGNFLED